MFFCDPFLLFRDKNQLPLNKKALYLAALHPSSEAQGFDIVPII